MRSIISLIALSSICCLVGCSDSSDDFRTIKKKLRKGSQNGKYRFSHTGQISFSREPTREVQMCVIGKDRAKFYTTEVLDDLSFQIDAELKPGEYDIYSEIINEQPSSGYWGAFGGKLSISEKGRMTLETQPILHKLKIQLLSPINKVLVVDSRPTLKWEPMVGTKHYSISWYKKDDDVQYEDIRQGMTTTNTQYVIEEELEHNETYCWSIRAIDESRNDFAYYSVGAFVTDEKLK